jgi:hypothetical protein
MNKGKARFDGKTMIVAALALLGAAGANAAPEEIQVYLDDLNQVGQFGVDVHNNYVLSGSSQPEYDGARPPLHVFRLTPEFSYGLSSQFELGAYVLTSVDADNRSHVDGEKVRIKYIAPHDETKGAFWGANIEVGRTDRSVSPQSSNVELKGILGYRSGDWLFAANANIDRALVDGDPAMIEVDGKVALRLDHKNQVGFETYNELGEVRHPGQYGQRSQMLYAVLDSEVAKFDLNLGIGRGLTDASDRWVLKAIVGYRF